jgi:hypothetical protein
MARTKAIIWVRLCVSYDAESLHDQFGVRFRLVESAKELHRTPTESAGHIKGGMGFDLRNFRGVE